MSVFMQNFQEDVESFTEGKCQCLVCNFWTHEKPFCTTFTNMFKIYCYTDFITIMVVNQLLAWN